MGDTLVTVIEGAVAYTYPSDMRLKKNIIDIGAGTEFIKKLRPVQFQYKKSTDGPQNWGFIAQDIEAIVGHDNAILTISGDAQKTLGLRYTDFIAPMVKAIQEQQSTIEQLKKENASLKDRLDKIEALLEKK